MNVQGLKEDKSKPNERWRAWVNGCKVVIYNYVFVGFYFVPNLIVIMFNLLYLVFIVGFICKGCVWERESVKTQGKLKIEVFSQVARK